MVALAAAAVLAIGWVTASIRLSYFHPADARELLVQVQSSQDVPKVRDEIVRLTSLAAKEGHPIVPQVDSWGGTGWPWSWYLRDVPTFYHDMSQPEDLKPGPIVLVADPNYEEMKSKLRGYEARRFTLRVWWVADWGSAGVRDWVRWALFRKAWSPTATMDEWIYLSPEAQRLAAQQR
jgi:hypothetical protein